MKNNGFYYDDGWEEIRLEKAEIPENSVKAYRLCDGDIFTIINTVIEFEDNMFYEVVKDGFSIFGQKWKRTGKTFTIDELNELAKGGL